MSDDSKKKLSVKERQKAFRREQYKKQKERFKNSDYYKAMKEKQKEYRKLAYQLAKERALSRKLESEKQPELEMEPMPAPRPKGPPKLRLITNSEFEPNAE